MLLARRVDYALLVIAERADHAVAKQLFVTLAAAERKVHRTHGRGLHAKMQLVRITPATGHLPEEIQLIGGVE